MSDEGGISPRTAFAMGNVKQPRLIFTLDGSRNPKSAQVVKKILECKSGAKSSCVCERCVSKLTLSCIVFTDLGALTLFLREKEISHSETVELNDGVLKGGLLSYAYHYGKYSKNFPRLTPSPWGVLVNPALSDGRILTVTNQIYADFHRNFAGRLAKNQLPWGQAPDPMNADSRRVRRRVRKPRRSNRSGRPSPGMSFVSI
jgi:hypothetical protein